MDVLVDTSNSQGIPLVHSIAERGRCVATVDEKAFEIETNTAHLRCGDRIVSLDIVDSPGSTNRVGRGGLACSTYALQYICKGYQS